MSKLAAQACQQSCTPLLHCVVVLHPCQSTASVCFKNYVITLDVCAAGASAAQPGLRINLSRGGGNLLRQFPDALTPYMHFGCSMEVSQGSPQS
jgi:hypothetical protein